DPRLQTQQQVQESRDRQFNYVSLYRADGKFVRIADEESPDVVITSNGKLIIGTNDGPYEREGNLDGRSFRDVYAVDPKTGQKKVIKKELRWGNSPSPDGTKYLYYDSRHFWLYDIDSGQARNITAAVPTSFVNVEDDHNIVDPPTN